MPHPPNGRNLQTSLQPSRLIRAGKIVIYANVDYYIFRRFDAFFQPFIIR